MTARVAGRKACNFAVAAHLCVMAARHFAAPALLVRVAPKSSAVTAKDANYAMNFAPIVIHAMDA